jgi:hypothetical protein
MAKISLTRYLEYCEPYKENMAKLSLARNFQVLRFRFFRFMVFNSTFNNISVISWQFYCFEETRTPVENDQPVTSLLQTLSSGVKHHKPKPEYEWNRQCEDMFPPPTKLTVTI